MIICYNEPIGKGCFIQIYAMMIINSISSSCIVMMPVSYLKSSNALAGGCTVFGALIGFLTGTYLPIGTLKTNVAFIVKAFPVSHGTALFRQLFTDDIVSAGAVSDNISASKIKEYLGIEYILYDDKISAAASMAFLLTAALLCIMIVLARNILVQKLK